MKKINPKELKKNNENRVADQLSLCRKCTRHKSKCKCKKGYAGTTSEDFGMLVK
jgi:hypothetical protein